MEKVKTIAAICLAVAFLYLIMSVIVPFLSDVGNATANQVATNANVAAGLYPGAEEAPRMLPLIVWFIPGIAGIVGVVWVLRRGRGEASA